VLRWVFIIIGVPLLAVLGLSQSLQTNPPAGMPQQAIVVGTGGQPQSQQGTGGQAAAAIAVPVPTPGPGSGTGEGGGALQGRLEQMVAYAKTWLGVPYLWGGNTMRGVDCSSFVQHVYASLGINVPRTTTTQIAAFTFVPRAEMRVGDAVFFNDTCIGCGPNPTHVGLYLGNGLMIDAGDPVKVEPVYWNKFRAAGRPPGL
jgi:cell wall-associated NlpC family hydrolase